MITPHQARQIAVLAVMSDRTVRRCYEHSHETYPAMRIRIVQAARRLGLPEPPSTSSSDSSPTQSPSDSGR